MQSRDMTWGYSFGKSPRLAREIDLSRTVLFLREATRAVRRPNAARDEVHARERDG